MQTEDQYIFIHDALLEAVVTGYTEVPCRSLHHHIQQLMQTTEVGEGGAVGAGGPPGSPPITGMELEFKKLSNVQPEHDRFVSANMPSNKFKNRSVPILRPKLKIF